MFTKTFTCEHCGITMLEMEKGHHDCKTTWANNSPIIKPGSVSYNASKRTMFKGTWFIQMNSFK